MGWFPVGLSAMLTLLAALHYTDVFGEAYAVGYKYLVLPLAIGCCLPLLTRVILPLYYQLGISSIYEYLERRYDVRVRCSGSAMCVLWRVLWLASILCATGKILGMATGLSIDVGWVLVVLGMASTLFHGSRRYEGRDLGWSVAGGRRGGRTRPDHRQCLDATRRWPVPRGGDRTCDGTCGNCRCVVECDRTVDGVGNLPVFLPDGVVAEHRGPGHCPTLLDGQESRGSPASRASGVAWGRRS